MLIDFIIKVLICRLSIFTDIVHHVDDTDIVHRDAVYVFDPFDLPQFAFQRIDNDILNLFGRGPGHRHDDRTAGYGDLRILLTGHHFQGDVTDNQQKNAQNRGQRIVQEIFRQFSRDILDLITHFFHRLAFHLTGTVTWAYMPG